MADNVTLPASSGTFVAAADEISAGVYVQRIKVTFGTDGTATDVSAASPLPVDIGAATIELGATSLAALESVTATGPLTDTQLRATPVPVSGTFWQTTQPVSGTITANAGSGTFAISAAALPLPSGASTAANQSTANGHLATIAGAIKTEDAPAVSGDAGIMALAMRQLADTTSTDNDGDYTALKIDEEGRLKVATKPASYVATTGNITTNGGIVWINCSRASNIVFSMVATSLVGHNVAFEVSNNTTNGTDGAWYGMQAIRTNANTIETSSGTLAATPAYGWEVSVNGWNAFRVRATAHTSGTAAYILQPGSYATEPIPAAQVSATQPISGSLTSAGTTTNTPATPTASIVNSAATTNGTVVKGSAGTIYGVVASNTNAATRFLKLHNSATVTPGTTAVALTIPIPSNTVVSVNFGELGMRFGTGICLSITGAAGDSDTTAIGANEVKVNTAYI